VSINRRLDDPAGPSDDPANDRATAGSNDGPSDRARPRAPRRAGSPGRRVGRVARRLMKNGRPGEKKFIRPQEVHCTTGPRALAEQRKVSVDCFHSIQ